MGFVRKALPALGIPFGLAGLAAGSVLKKALKKDKKPSPSLATSGSNETRPTLVTRGG